MQYFSTETGKTIKYSPPVLEITVHLPFIFDNRLIPKSFDGIKMKNVVIAGSFPKEFPSQNAALPLEEWFSPKNYETFVAQNLELIRKKTN